MQPGDIVLRTNAYKPEIGRVVSFGPKTVTVEVGYFQKFNTVTKPVFRQYGSKESAIFPDHDALLRAVEERLAASSERSAIRAVSDAVRLYPLGPALFGGTIVGIGGLVAGAVAGRTWTPRLARTQRRALAAGVVAAILFSWALKVFVLGN